jgi:phosphohistidine phosphatase
MHLFLVRHGIAEDRLKYILKFSDDNQRPLTVKGKKRFKKLAPRLKQLIGPLDMIISSPFLRAQQTAKILSELYPHVKFKTTKTLAPTALPNEWLQWIGINIENKNSRIVVVGHEPHLSSLASWLLFGDSQSRMIIKKGGCIAIGIKATLGPATGILQWAVTPKTLDMV